MVCGSGVTVGSGPKSLAGDARVPGRTGSSEGDRFDSRRPGLTAAPRARIPSILWRTGLALGLGGLGVLAAEQLRLDPDFKPLITTTNGVELTAAALQPDGKLVVAGHFDVFHGQPRSGIARLGPAGGLDEGFTFSGGLLGRVSTVAIQPDGRILLGGAFTAGPAPSRRNLIRLEPDGGIDDTFRSQIEGAEDCEVCVICLLDDGRMAVGGTFEGIGAAPRRGVAVLLADGSMDETFDPGAAVEDRFGRVDDITPTRDGGLMVAGLFTKFNGRQRSGLVELDATGAINEAFALQLDSQIGLPAVTKVRQIEHGRWLIAGRFDEVDGQPRREMARLTVDGRLDEDFQVGGDLLGHGSGLVRDFVVLSGGYILLAGDFLGIGDVPRPGLMRLDGEGSIDPGFELPGGVQWADGSAGWASAVAVQRDGALVVLGGFDRLGDAHRHLIGRLFADGAVDDAYSSPDLLVERGGSVGAIAVLADGSVLAGGDFERVDGLTRHGLVRWDAGGRLDTAFDGALAPGSVVNALAVQPDGKLLVGGLFSEVQGQDHANLVRLDSTGQLDPTFAASANPSGEVYCLALGPEGQVAIGGNFEVVGGVARERIALVDTNGNVDPDFQPALFYPRDLPEAYCLGMQPDGCLLVGGFFDRVNGERRLNLARLRLDGSLDPTFDPHLDVDGDLPLVLTLAIAPDATILVGGAFERVNGRSRRGIARLNPDGTLDTTFVPGRGVEGGTLPLVYAAAIVGNGDILLGGDFDTLDGQTRRNLGGVGPTGTLGTTVDGALGTDRWVQAVAVQPGRAVLVGGAFTRVAGAPRLALARLLHTPLEGPELRVWTEQDQVVIDWDGSGRLQSSERATGPWQDESTNGMPVRIDPIHPARFYRLVE